MSNARQYADSDNVSIAQAQEQLAHILRTKQGKQDAISSKELGKMVGLKATTVRDIIPEIRCVHGIPVSSCPGGYYVIDSTEDFRETMDGIEQTIQTKKQHQRELAEAWYNE